MKTDKVDIVRDILVVQANHWIFFPLVVFGGNAEGVLSLSIIDIAGFLLLGVVAEIMCFIMKQDIKLLVLMPVPVVAYIFAIRLFDLSAGWIMVVLIMLTCAYFVFFLVKSLREVDPYLNVIPPYVVLVIFFILWATMKAEHIPTNYFPYNMGMIVSITFYLFAMYLENYQQFTYMNETTSASMPRKKIFRSGIYMSSSYIVLGVLVMLAIALMTITDSLLDKLFLGILRAIVGLFKEEDDVTREEFEVPQLGIPETEQGDPSLFWKILEIIFAVMMIIILIIAVVMLIRALIKVIRNYKFPEYNRKAYKIVLEDGTEDEYEKLDEKLMEKKDRGGKLTIDQKIRRLYKKHVIYKVSDEKKRSHLTAREFVKEQGDDLVADVYEKARYSDEQCTKEELKNMQALCHK